MNYKTDNNGHYIVPLRDFVIKSKKTTGIVRCECPMCRDERTHGHQACVKLNMNTGWGNCFKCGRVFVTEESYSEWRRKWKRCEPKAGAYKSPDILSLRADFTPACLEYLKYRCISPDTARKAGVQCMVKYFGMGQREDYLAFRFLDGDKTVNIQYKLADREHKKFFFTPGAELIPYNVNACLGAGEVIITEGMMDTLAIMECGYDNVISVANGSGTDLRTFDKYMDSHFKPLRRIIFAGDMDENGLELRQKIVAYFGEARCDIVDWGEAKDANEVLMTQGKDAVVRYIENRKRSPLKGLVTLGDIETDIDALLENGMPVARTIGMAGFDPYLKIEDGLLYLGFAAPGNGKSAFVDYIVAAMVHMYDFHVLIFSPEKYPVARHYAEFISLMLDSEFGKSAILPSAYGRAKRMVSEHISEIDGEECNDIDAILHIAQQQYYRGQMDMLVIDPFNWIRLPEVAGVTDSMKYSEVLIKLVKFIHMYNVPVFLMHHPRKFDDKTRLTINDIYGSSDFGNKADFVFTLERDTRLDATFFHCLKCRWPELGIGGATAPLRKNEHSDRFYYLVESRDENGQKCYVPLSNGRRNYIDHTDWTERLCGEGNLSDQALGDDHPLGEPNDTKDLPF